MGIGVVLLRKGAIVLAFEYERLHRSLDVSRNVRNHSCEEQNRTFFLHLGLIQSHCILRVYYRVMWHCTVLPKPQRPFL